MKSTEDEPEGIGNIVSSMNNNFEETKYNVLSVPNPPKISEQNAAAHQSPENLCLDEMSTSKSMHGLEIQSEETKENSPNRSISINQVTSKGTAHTFYLS